MNAQLVFTLADLGKLVIWALVVIILIYLILVLIRFYTSFKKLMKIVDENRENINQVLDEAPAITQNVNIISDEVANTMTAFRGTVDNVAHTSEEVTGQLKDNKDIIAKMSSFFEVLHTFRRYYNKFRGIEEDDTTYEPNTTNDQPHEGE